MLKLRIEKLRYDGYRISIKCEDEIEIIFGGEADDYDEAVNLAHSLAAEMEEDEYSIYVRCTDCRGWRRVDDEDDIQLINNRPVCPDCGFDYAACYHCGEYVHVDEAVFGENIGDFVCAECIEDYYVQCEFCGEYIHEADAAVVYDDGSEVYVCESCRDVEAGQCDECGEWHMINDLRYSELNEDLRCPDCYDEAYEELVVPYHAGNPECRKYLGNGEYYIGCELEYIGNAGIIASHIHHDCGIGFDFCHFEADNSVDIEVISQPMTLTYIEDNLATWNTLFGAVIDADGYDTKGCGLHVHFSRSAFGDDEDKRVDNIAKMAVIYTMYYDLLGIYAGRVSTRWAEPNGYDYDAIREEAAKPCKKNKHKVAVNLQHTNTVEFRLARSTTSTLKWLSWVYLLDELIKYVVVTDDDWLCEDWEQTIENCAKDAYLMAKNAIDNLY